MRQQALRLQRVFLIRTRSTCNCRNLKMPIPPPDLPAQGLVQLQTWKGTLHPQWCTWSPDLRCRGVLEFGMIQLDTCTRGSQSRCDMTHSRERAPELCRIKNPWKKCASMEPRVGCGSCIASLNSRTMICRSMHMYA